MNKRKKQETVKPESLLLNERRVKTQFFSTVDTICFPSDLGFDGTSQVQNLKFIIRGIFTLLFSSILSELLFRSVICLLFTSAWIQQGIFKHTSIVYSLTWDFDESFLSSFSSRYGLSYHVEKKMHVSFQIRPRLVFISFLDDSSPALSVSFNEVLQNPECEFIQRRSFFLPSVFCIA